MRRGCRGTERPGSWKNPSLRWIWGRRSCWRRCGRLWRELWRGLDPVRARPAETLQYNDKEASQTRDYCVAALLIRSIATLRAGRPDPSRDKRRLAQDDKQTFTTSCTTSLRHFSAPLSASDWAHLVQVDSGRCPTYQGALTVKMRSLPRARRTHSRRRPR